MLGQSTGGGLQLGTAGLGGGGLKLGTGLGQGVSGQGYTIESTLHLDYIYTGRPCLTTPFQLSSAQCHRSGRYVNSHGYEWTAAWRSWYWNWTGTWTDCGVRN